MSVRMLCAGLPAHESDSPLRSDSFLVTFGVLALEPMTSLLSQSVLIFDYTMRSIREGLVGLSDGRRWRKEGEMKGSLCSRR